jgi:hypothetical protein
MTHKNEENLSFEMHARCFLLRDEDFSCSLDVIYGDIGKSKLQFLVIKTVDQDPDPHWFECGSATASRDANQ